MTERNFAIADEELHAFIDGEVDAARAAEIARAMDSDTALSRKMLGFRADKLRLQRAYASMPEAPLPQSWVSRIDEYALKQQARRKFGRIPETLIAVAALILVVVFAWAIEGGHLAAPGDDQIIREALAARDQIARPQQVFTAASLPAPDRRDALISAALMMKIRVPDLAKLGYRFDSLRIYDAVSGSKAVELDYRNAGNRFFTLYLRRPSSPPRVDILERGHTRICIWQDDVIGAVMAGEITAGEMARLASLAYSGLYL